MPRERREPTGAGAGFAPDPSRIGGVAEAPIVRLPDPATLFATRAARFRVLAEGHVLGPYLSFLGEVAAGQAAVVAGLPAPLPLPAAQTALAAEHGMPPLGGQRFADGALAAVVTGLLARIALDGAPEAAREAVERVRAMPAATLAALAEDVMQGAFPTDRVAETLFVAAALQVHLSLQASALEAASVTPPAEGVCPACGGAPVSSLVVGWTAASKARYCACSLCGTLWNHVRIKCTACASTEGIAYYTIEDGSKTVGVETCTTCQSYTKHMQQHEETGLDPVADDVASYALDLLAREKGFRRSSLNPLFLSD